MEEKNEDKLENNDEHENMQEASLNKSIDNSMEEETYYYKRYCRYGIIFWNCNINCSLNISICRPASSGKWKLHGNHIK